MSLFLVIMFLFCLTFDTTLSSEFSHERQHKKLPSAVIVGKVYCDTCFQQIPSTTSRFISGASVAVECQYGTNSNPEFKRQVKTNDNGEFSVSLPCSISKHLKKIKGCAVKLEKSNDPYCSVASSASIHLKNLKNKNEEHIFSAGFLSFKPLQQPTVCNQKQLMSLNSSKGFVWNNPLRKRFLPPGFGFGFKLPPPLQLPPISKPNLNPIPTMPQLPALPKLPELPPLPQLPPLPRLPRLPGSQFPIFPPFPEKSERKVQSVNPIDHEKKGEDPSQADFFFFPPNPLQPPIVPNPLQPPPLIPNPLQPPPASLIPNPFQPPPAPLIPNPFQPPPAPLIPNPFQPPPTPPAPLLPLPPIPGLTPLPPLPGLTPSPPPPPPPSFPFIPLPPLLPGRPPASPTRVRNSP